MQVEQEQGQMPPGEQPETVTGKLGAGPPVVETKALSATGFSSGVAMALGALSVGALAFGVIAIGRLAIGRLGIGRARVGRLEIDELVIRRVTDRTRKRS
jgi:hypothetical protein